MFRQVFQFPLLSRRHLKPVGLVVCLLSFASGCGLANQGLNSKGVQYFQQGRHQEALRTFEEVVTNDPLNTDGHYNLAATYHRLALEKQDSKLLAQSEQLYRQCLHLDSNNADGYRGLAVLMMQSAGVNRHTSCSRTGPPRHRDPPSRRLNWPGFTTRGTNWTKPNCISRRHSRSTAITPGPGRHSLT